MPLGIFWGRGKWIWQTNEREWIAFCLVLIFLQYFLCLKKAVCYVISAWGFSCYPKSWKLSLRNMIFKLYNNNLKKANNLFPYYFLNLLNVFLAALLFNVNFWWCGGVHNGMDFIYNNNLDLAMITFQLFLIMSPCYRSCLLPSCVFFIDYMISFFRGTIQQLALIVDSINNRNKNQFASRHAF